MTLVLAASLPECVVQVSDRRITLADGQHTEAPTKAILFCGHFLVSFTGRAEAGGDATVEWVAAALSEAADAPAGT